MRKLCLVLMCFFFLYSSAEAQFWPSTVGDVFHKGYSGYDVRSYGAKGDGVTDDEPAFTLAIAAAAGGRVIITEAPTSYRLSSNVTVPLGVTLVFRQGGKLYSDAGVTVTVNGTIEAGLYQIFSGDGDVSLAAGSCEYVLPQWWGAVGDNATDDTVAIQSAIDSVTASGGGVLFFPGGTYITTTLYLKDNVTLRGIGSAFSSIKLKDFTDNYHIRVPGANSVVENLTIDGNKVKQGAGTLHCIWIHSTATGARIRNNIIKDTKRCGIISQSLSADNVTIKDNSFVECDLHAIYYLNAGFDNLRITGNHFDAC